jgi:hypothetical protein
MNDERRTVGSMIASGAWDPVPPEPPVLATVAEFAVRLHHMLTVAPNLDHSDIPQAATELIAGIIHLAGDGVLEPAATMAADQRSDWLVYDHHRPGDHHGPSGPWKDCPACRGGNVPS